MKKAAKVQLKLVRSFGLGVDILSPSLNGLCIHIRVACFTLAIWSRGDGWFEARSYWGKLSDWK